MEKLVYLAMFDDRKYGPFQASSLLDAHTKAIEALKPRKSQRHMVSVRLIEVAGETVVHTPDY